MRTRVEVVARAARAPFLDARGALVARVATDGTVHLVGVAAGPLGGDEVDVRVVVEPGACLRLCSAAATLVLPGRLAAGSASRWDVEVADGGSLVVCPQPSVVTGRARHATTTSARVGEGASLVLLERVQLGRAGEDPGRWTGRLEVDLAGRPVLRHELDLGPGSATHDVLEHAGAVRSLLTVGAGAPDAAAVADDRHAVTLELAGGAGTLSTELSATLAPSACPR